jgi:AraC-like DNA-binding protein
MVGKECSSQDLNVNAFFCPISENPVQATLEKVSRDRAYLKTDNPPNAGEVVKVMAGTALQSMGSVMSVQPAEDSQFGFSVQLFQPDAGAREKTDPALWSYEPGEEKESPFSYYARLRKVKDYVQKHYSEEITLERAARIAAMERTYFSTFFRQKVGLTYRKWLQLQRVGKAIEMIKRENASITEVGFSVGFGDLRTFERAFKRWTGLTPRTFKKMISPMLVFLAMPLLQFLVA